MSDLQSMSVDDLVALATTQRYVGTEDWAANELARRLRAAEAGRDKWRDANAHNAAKVQELEDAESLLKAERDEALGASLLNKNALRLARAEVARLQGVLERMHAQGCNTPGCAVCHALAAQPEPARDEGIR